MPSSDQVIKNYLAKIGRRGGKISRRSLDATSARTMVKVREAKRAYRKFHAMCFWSFDPNMKISKDDVAWVAEQLMKHGSLDSWRIGRKLCQ